MELEIRLALTPTLSPEEREKPSPVSRHFTEWWLASARPELAC